MKTVSMSGSLRENVGKKDAKKNRKDGKIPCVLYGGKDRLHFTMEDKSLFKIIFTPEVFFLKLTVDGKEYDAVLQDVQFHPTTDCILHVDFLELLPNKPVTIGIPVKLKGTAKGVTNGGILVNKYKKLRVMGLKNAIPEEVVLQVNDLDIGDSIKVKDIKIENVELLDAANSVVVGVRVARAIEEKVADATAVEGAAEGAPAAAGAAPTAPGAAPAAPAAAPAAKEGGKEK